ncbi:MAG: Gfo/Idh/MocA family oxidoreductase [Acidobacteriota bacterium]
MTSRSVSRRAFVPGAAALTVVPRHVLGGAGRQAPSDKLNIAGIGVGGVGASYLRGCESENIAFLCDVDDIVAAKTFARYPNAKTYRDFRVMLEKEKGIDAVVIGTPDHTHAVIALAAMQLGKHVYCAKPLTRTVHEARRLARAAREAKVATQMSVQSCASEGACSTAEWVQTGAVGAVREVHVWTDRPIWPQGLARPDETHGVPSSLDWDLWLGPAPARPYHPIYHPFNWRGWCDFGTGAVGDMACHTLHVIFRALKLGPPASAHASSTAVMQPVMDKTGERLLVKRRVASFPETFPHSAIITWEFPARGDLPPARVTWYEGGLKPPRPLELEAGQPLPASGILFAGEKGVLLSGFSGGPRLVPEEKTKAYTPPPKTTPRTVGHYQEWVEACKGGKPANCEFEFATLITETALLGTVAVRTGKHLVWDAATMRITNDADANQYVNEPYRAGWAL